MVPAVTSVKGDRLGDCVSVNRSQSYVNSMPMPIIPSNKNNRNIIVVTDPNWSLNQSVIVISHTGPFITL